MTTSHDTERRRERIPPHIFWPSLVVGILLLSVGANVGLIVAALSDDGPQIVDDYYGKALRWDEQKALLEQSRELGWRTDIMLEGDRVDANASGQRVVVVVADLAGSPVGGLKGQLLVRHAARSDVEAVDLTPVAADPGRYEGVVPLDRPGLWDFTVDVHKGATRFLETQRKELSVN